MKLVKNLGLTRRIILRWKVHECDIILSKSCSRRLKSSRGAAWPELEEQLVREFNERIEAGLRVKGWWFVKRAKAIKRQLNPTHPIKFSNGWLEKFQRRHGISNRACTSTGQNPPADKVTVVRKFHRFIRRNTGRVGHWSAIANMDQTPMPFVFGGGKTFSLKGKSTIWVRGGQSGYDKRQCTVQLTVFSDGNPRVKPLIIFRGAGKRLSVNEKQQWDDRVTVCFQKNAWCDEEVMKMWIDEMWCPAVEKLGSKHLLVADVHKAQKTKAVLARLKEIGTTPALIPPGCTSLLQPLDVSFNKPFKQKCADLFHQHMEVREQS